jgi:hypothetical protein
MIAREFAMVHLMLALIALLQPVAAASLMAIGHTPPSHHCTSRTLYLPAPA